MNIADTYVKMTKKLMYGHGIVAFTLGAISYWYENADRRKYRKRKNNRTNGRNI